MTRITIFLLTCGLVLGGICLIHPEQPVMADPVRITPLPPVEVTDGRAGSCYSNYYEHGNRPFLSLVHAAGVRHDRIDLIWAIVEPENDGWNFGPYDELFADELAEGVEPTVILQWTPDWAATGTHTPGTFRAPERPPSWYAPITRTQEEGERMTVAPSAWSSVPVGLYLAWDDPGNHWGDFVYQTVSRYRDTISVWEIWNEPDGNWGTWDGTPADYAQLLKVGYQAAKAANPDATVLFGGLMYWANPLFFEQVLDVVNDDPSALAHNHFFDVMSVHFYSRSSDAYAMVNQIRQRMQVYVPDHPIWLTETGVPVHDGPYPGLRTEFSATEVEAAAYLIQSYANGIAAGIGRYHWFRAHDGDMAEHFGLTHDETYLRPAYVAYQVATTYLISPTFVTRQESGDFRNVTLWGTPHGRVSVLWNKSPVTATYVLPAALPTATLVSQSGVTRTEVATDVLVGSAQFPAYTVTLPAATAHRPPPNEQDYIIGGAPVLLIESETVNEPPTATVHPLPAVAYTPVVTVTWEGRDNQAGIWQYDVQVRDGIDGAWIDWQTSTVITASQFTGKHGHTYYFRARATDRVGHRSPWSEASQAQTTFDLTNTFRVHIDAFFADDNRNGVQDISGTVTLEMTLTQVSLRFFDGAGRDVVTPTTGKSWTFTVPVYVGETYHLWATTPDYRRELSFSWSYGGDVYTYTRNMLGLWPMERIYLPLILRLYP